MLKWRNYKIFLNEESHSNKAELLMQKARQKAQTMAEQYGLGISILYGVRKYRRDDDNYKKLIIYTDPIVMKTQRLSKKYPGSSSHMVLVINCGN